MFKIGVIHSFFLIVISFSLTLLLTMIGIKEQSIDLTIYLLIIIIVMCIGFKFKHKTGIAPFSALITKRHRYLFYYPLGLAVFPALTNTIVSSDEFSSVTLIAMLPLSIFSYSIAFGTQIILGSLFCRKVTV